MITKINTCMVIRVEYAMSVAKAHRACIGAQSPKIGGLRSGKV